jgi:hypothetical protein
LIRAINTALCVVIGLMPMATRAQLRPLEPPQWRMLDESASVAAEVGAARLFGQRASLAGSTGDLWEAGNFMIAWRTGRVIIEAAGTAQRFFHETGSFAAPYPDVEPAADGDRHDSGDYRISTTVRVTPSGFPATGVVRFGTRLPTTDNTTGLDRDALDFFATVGGIGTRGALAVAGEAGLGIHTTREPTFEQDDVLLYSLRMELRSSVFTPSLVVVGQKHGPTHDSLRGVEDLGELRAGVRIGRHLWARAEFVKGYEAFSPSSGFIVTAGVIR